MAIREYRAIATKTAVKGEEVHVTSAVEGGDTIRIVYGLAPLAVVMTALHDKLKEGAE
jgi:hypothetical protein